MKSETIDKEKIIYCADAIAFYEDSDRVVIVQRLGSVKGLALPGGKKDKGETLTETIIREVFEETGLTFVPGKVLGTYAEPGRDPRGRYVSTVFVGKATGVIKDEVGKTKVILIDSKTVLDQKKDFMFDHGDILERYLA